MTAVAWRRRAEAPLFGAGRLLAALAERPAVLGDCGGLWLWPSCWALTDVRVLPEESVVVSGDRLLSEGLAINPVLLRRGHYPRVRPAAGGFEVRLGPVRDVIESPVLLIGGDVGGNTYHWLLDYFPKMLVLARHGAAWCGGSPPRFAVVGGRGVVAEGLLRLAGIPAEAVIELDAAGSLLFRRLVVVSNFTQYGFVSPVLPGLLPPVTVPGAASGRRRLYVSRGDATTRRLVNEAAVLAALAPLGVEAVRLSGLDLAAQRRLFATADLVIGPHGAGLANLVWTPPDCRLLEIRPAVAALWQYERLCLALRRRLAVVSVAAGDLVGCGANADMRIDPRRVAAAALRLLADSGGRAGRQLI